MATPVKIKATVEEVVRHTGSVASYRFAPQGRVPKFHPGQFLHLALDEYAPDRQWPESRVFSIASSPAERAQRLDLTISVKGRFTRKIYDTLDTGAECWLKLPYGSFLFPSAGALVLVAGGVGITPFLSLLKQMLDERSTQPARLCYGVRSADYYLFGELIARCEAELPGFSKTIYCEDGTVPGHRGMLDIEAIRAAAPADALFYLSGPPPMISAFKTRLLETGVAADRVRVDDWE